MGVMGLTAILAKGFMYCLNDTRVSGLDGFLGYLDKRRGPDRRRGLLTVSNHVSVYVPIHVDNIRYNNTPHKTRTHMRSAAGLGLNSDATVWMTL